MCLNAAQLNVLHKILMFKLILLSHMVVSENTLLKKRKGTLNHTSDLDEPLTEAVNLYYCIGCSELSMETKPVEGCIQNHIDNQS